MIQWPLEVPDGAPTEPCAPGFRSSWLVHTPRSTEALCLHPIHRPVRLFILVPELCPLQQKGNSNVLS